MRAHRDRSLDTLVVRTALSWQAAVQNTYMERDMNFGNDETRLIHAAQFATTALCSLLMSACVILIRGTVVPRSRPAPRCRQTIAAQRSPAAIPASGPEPTYCKVNGTIAPALNFEFRLPDAWNGKLYYIGGGGYDGSFYVSGPPTTALKQGYATAASDGGHQGSPLSADFALTDTFAAQLFGSLSVPTVMSTALEAVTAAYGTPPSKSYLEGCSNGGREALMAVQRNPNLFDGVIARAPAYNWVGFMGAFNRTARALAAPEGAFSTAKTGLLGNMCGLPAIH